MFPRNKRVASVRDRTLSELRLGASIKNKLYEIELETRSQESSPASPSNVPIAGIPPSTLTQMKTPLPPSPLARPPSPLPISPLARVKVGSSGYGGSVRQVTIREPVLNRAKTTKDVGYRGGMSFKKGRSLKKSFSKARGMTLRQPIGAASPLFNKRSLNRVMSLKHGGLSRGSSAREGLGQFNRVLSVNRKQLQELTGEEADISSSDDDDQYTVIIQRNEPADIWSALAADEARLSSMKKFRFSSLRRLSDSEESEEEVVERVIWDGYLTQEEQYELRKKIFHKGEYMILNYALILMILIAVFSIIFCAVWHAFQENDMGMYIMLGVALSVVLIIVVLVKVRLRLARRAPGGYKFRRDDQSTVIDNVATEPDLEKASESGKSEVVKDVEKSAEVQKSEAVDV